MPPMPCSRPHTAEHAGPLPTISTISGPNRIVVSKPMGDNVTDPLLIERRGAVEVWTLNNPERRNPVTGTEFIATFAEHMARVNDSGDVGAVVLTGAGSAFSTGGDVKAMARREGMFDADVAALRGSYRKNVQSIPRLMSLNEVPFVAAVNGPAVGAGCDLAFMCDLRIASEKAFFAESFVKLGLIPGELRRDAA